MIVDLKIEPLRLPQKLLHSLETYRSHGPSIPLTPQSSVGLMKSQLLPDDPLAFGATVPSGTMGSSLLSGRNSSDSFLESVEELEISIPIPTRWTVVVFPSSFIFSLHSAGLSLLLQWQTGKRNHQNECYLWYILSYLQKFLWLPRSANSFHSHPV